jgi:uncharacterized membrane protein
MKNKKWLLISIPAIIAFLIFFYFNIYEIEENIPMRADFKPEPNIMPMPIPIQYRTWISPLLLIVAIVPISYYFISKKLEKNMKVILKIISKNGINVTNNLKTKSLAEISNKNTILKLLNFNERKILEKLIERKGDILQSEISRMEGMNKLKTHRAMRNLELKGVIKTESHGKTKRVILSKDIESIMLK